jgi:hypothetical protein
LTAADAKHLHWDLIFTDIFVNADFHHFFAFAEKRLAFEQSGKISLLDLEQFNFACTSSVVVNERSIDKYSALMTGKWAVGIPIDLYIRQLVHTRQLKAFVTLPFLTTISRNSMHSDIRGGLDLPRKVTDVLRRAFFKDADLPALLKESQDLTRDASLNPLNSIFLNTVLLRLSDQWVGF